jgi:hypothetical protein
LDNLALALAAAAALVFLVLIVRAPRTDRIWTVPTGLLLMDLALIAQFVHVIHGVTRGPVN